MKTRDSNARSKKSMASFGFAALLAVTAATAQVATETGIDNSGSFQKEVQSCNTGKTQQDRETCLKEARNAQADKKRGLLESTNGKLEANAKARCDALSGEDKAACHARVLGFGNTSGSVAGGGLLREVETVVMPPSGSVTVEPKTADPVVLVPTR